MTFTPADLEMANRHVQAGERHVASQRAILDRLREHGHPTDMAETLLAEFEQTLEDHICHRDRIAAALHGEGPWGRPG